MSQKTRICTHLVAEGHTRLPNIPDNERPAQQTTNPHRSAPSTSRRRSRGNRCGVTPTDSKLLRARPVSSATTLHFTSLARSAHTQCSPSSRWVLQPTTTSALAASPPPRTTNNDSNNLLMTQMPPAHYQPKLSSTAPAAAAGSATVTVGPGRYTLPPRQCCRRRA